MEFDPPPPPFEGSGMGARRIFGRVLGFGGTRVMFTGDGDNRINEHDHGDVQQERGKHASGKAVRIPWRNPRAFSGRVRCRCRQPSQV